MKSPVASLCLDCSSVKNRVRVTMSVLIFSWATGGVSPFVAIVYHYLIDAQREQ